MAGGKPGSVTETVLASLTGRLGEKEKPSRQFVAIELNASADLNADESGNGLATVIRIYQLRDTIAFLSLPHTSHIDKEGASAMLGNALIEAREFTLVPGQITHFREVLDEGASHIGVVALFRKRAGQRWRLAFSSADATRAGIAIGVHACAMTASGAVPQGTNKQDALLLGATPCR